MGRRQGWRPLLSLAGWVCAGGAPFALMFLAYNQLRTGSPFQIGYPTGVTGRPAVRRAHPGGAVGVVPVPGQEPVAVLPAAAAGRWGRAPAAAPWRPRLGLGGAAHHRAGGAVLRPHHVLARRLVLGPALPGVRRCRCCSCRRCCGPTGRPAARTGRARRAKRAAAGGAGRRAWACSCWDRRFTGITSCASITKRARSGWAGPTAPGPASPDRGGWCDPCIEDLYGVNWLPAFSPHRGSPVAGPPRPVPPPGPAGGAGRALAPVHVADPGHRPSYIRARVDWWILDYGKDKGSPAA